MKYLALGTNLEPRRESLHRAKELLGSLGANIVSTSAIYETPALLPPHATDSWQLNYLNQVLAVEWSQSVESLLALCKEIEKQMGRQSLERWSPRPIDIDILLFDEIAINTPNLQIPHLGLVDRPFFLGPLVELTQKIRDQGVFQTYQNHYKRMQQKLPLWMSIVNVTPDSFSSTKGQDFQDKDFCLTKISEDLENGAHIIDIGAESTRPGATVLSFQQEWSRLERVLVEAARLCKKYEAQLSVDTYHPETMHLALQSGVTIINDVSGLRDPRGRNVFFNSTCDWVVMHNLGLPANKGVVLDHSKLAHQHIIDWVRDLEKHIPREHRHRLILDPGIGFGKSAEQSRDILKNWFVLKDLGYRVLIGHSRKSFLSGITQSKASDRDIETVALSLRLASEGVDILRIHKMDDHRRAHLAYLA